MATKVETQSKEGVADVEMRADTAEVEGEHSAAYNDDEYGQAQGGAGGSSSNSSVQLLSGATQQDADKAWAHCQTYNDEPVAVWRVNPENYNLCCKKVRFYFILPCLWPHAILCSPCVYFANKATNDALQGTTYILGKKNLYRIVEAEVGGVCCTTGNDSGFEKLSSITSVGVHNQAAPCACLESHGVQIAVPFVSPLSDYTGGGPPSFIMYVDNPDYAAGLINTAMENAQQLRGPQAPPQMMMQGAPGGGGPAVGTKEKLKELTEMYQMGLVSPAEFESKKAELLAGM
ncbi:unnamed protein product [Amoebophrya sp. A120]|nr:unnamed protein product [Amoebophrya sp. A120]|eukprot:GSA120T00000443001.1